MASRALAGVPLEEFNASTNMLLYGPPGAGKTSLAGGAPKALFWGCEPGVKAAKRQGSKASMIKITSWEQAWELLLTAESGQTGGHEWYIIDTISSFENTIMRSALDKGFAENPLKRSEYIPGIDQHQLRQNQLKRFVERMVDLPVNTLWLAHEMRPENDDGDTLLLPSISGGADKGYPVCNYIMGLMDCVGYINWKDVGGERFQRILWQTMTITKNKTTTIYTAKDQFDVFGAWTDGWTMPQIIKAIGAPPIKTGNSGPVEEPTEEPQEEATTTTPRRRRAARRS
jgi:hypothetical protein